MAYLVFARKYRPQNFDQVVQQEHVTRTLKNAIEAGRLAHAILFAGPRGTGKTTIARILAKAVNCKHGPAPEPCNNCRSCNDIIDGGAADVFEIDGASNNSVEQVRELRENLQYMPVHSRFKIYIIDEVHMLSTAAFNALLKTLEEPPGHVLFMFATTEPRKIPITILSRCQRHDLKRIETRAIVDQMAWICQQEGVDFDPKSLKDIARCAGGSMRDALSLLDQIVASTRDRETMSEVTRMLAGVDIARVYQMAAAILNNDIGEALKHIAEIYSKGDDIYRFYMELATAFRHMNVLCLGRQARSLVDLPQDEIDELAQMVAGYDRSRLRQVFETLVSSEATVKLAGQPRLAFEMILVRLAKTPPALPIETLIDKLDQVRKTVLENQAGAKGAVRPENAQQSPPGIKASGARGDGLPGLRVDLDQAWKKIAAAVGRKKPSLKVVLEKSRPLALDQGQLLVKLNGNGFSNKQVKKYIGLIEEQAGDIIGSPVKLKIQADTESSGDKKKQKAAEERIKQEAMAHPLVSDTLEIFDGKIYDVKVKLKVTGGNNP